MASRTVATPTAIAQTPGAGHGAGAREDGLRRAGGRPVGAACSPPMSDSAFDPAAVPAELVAFTERLHAAVDEAARPVTAANAARLRCARGCSGCCQDGLTVFTLEAAVIARRYPELLATGTAHATGACAFLDAAGACRIYEARPYVCRTQGLPLRWLEEDEELEIVETRDICPENAAGPALEELDADACWTLGPFEQRLADKQAEHVEGDRVALRSLFATERRRLPLAR